MTAREKKSGCTRSIPAVCQFSKGANFHKMCFTLQTYSVFRISFAFLHSCCIQRYKYAQPWIIYGYVQLHLKRTETHKSSQKWSWPVFCGDGLQCDEDRRRHHQTAAGLPRPAVASPSRPPWRVPLHRALSAHSAAPPVNHVQLSLLTNTLSDILN